ncbi:MAG: cell shape determination protein CcmA [Candidatus Nephrothrix sp. EaCA]|nr:MAG: cell shape determination protein CcmA [Candidatus Nephrothrix sp. EaCA]
MLTSKDQKRAADEISNSSNVIGKSTTITGTITAAGNLRVEGIVHGDINSQAKVALGSEARVEGNITAQNADLEGKVKGNLSITDVLVLKATAVITGDISTGKLVIEPGVVFNGNCKMANHSK